MRSLWRWLRGEPRSPEGTARMIVEFLLDYVTLAAVNQMRPGEIAPHVEMMERGVVKILCGERYAPCPICLGRAHLHGPER